jgi:hypothetical protein
MASQPAFQPHNSEGSPYCSDPDCPYCKELRQAQETVRENRPISQENELGKQLCPPSNSALRP